MCLRSCVTALKFALSLDARKTPPPFHCLLLDDNREAGGWVCTVHFPSVKQRLLAGQPLSLWLALLALP